MSPTLKKRTIAIKIDDHFIANHEITRMDINNESYILIYVNLGPNPLGTFLNGW